MAGPDRSPHRVRWARVPLGPRWLRHYDRDDLGPDVVAGLTVAVLLIPQAMAYASLAGMPPITGLYTALVALVVYGLAGTSSHLSYGPVALVGLLTATGVGPIAGGDTTRYVTLAATLALMVGLLHLILGALRAGRVVDLISHPVITGFTGAAGLVIALTQTRDLLGIDIARTERATDAVVALAGSIGDAHPATVAVSLLALLALLLSRRLSPRFPAVLVIVGAGILATIGFDLQARGVRLVGEIPAGLPRLVLPAIQVDDVIALIPVALVIALISFAESIAIGKSIAGRSRETLDADRELIASGLSNGAVALVGGFPVAGSFSRSALTFTARGRTPASGLVAALAVAGTLVLLTGLLEPLPRAVLAAIVLVTVIGLVDPREARRIARVEPRDGLVLAVTFVGTLLLGVEIGLAVGVGASIIFHVARGLSPNIVVLGRIPGTRDFRDSARQETITPTDGLILRLDGSLDFLSARTFTTEVRRAVATVPTLEWIVLECGAMSRLDATGLNALHELQLQLRSVNVRLFLAALRGPQRDVIARADLAGELLERASHATIDESLAAAGIPADALLRAPAADEVRPEQWP